jgi:hypothetical protein
MTMRLIRRSTASLRAQGCPLDLGDRDQRKRRSGNLED